MKIIKIFKIYLKSPRKLIKGLGTLGCFNWLSDKPYLKLVYLAETGKKLNLNKPVTYNEKIQWLKLYDRKSEYVKYVDKYAVRAYVGDTIGEQYLIPLLYVYGSVEEINWNSLPNRFVLKCTHGSGSNIICIDKNKLDIQASKMKLNKWMKKSWYWFGREWSYKNVKPRIICEKYMVDESGKELKDYKIFCFNGEPKLIQVDFNRFAEHKRNIYTTDWEYVELSIKYPNKFAFMIPKPKKLDKMLRFSRLLSKNIPHVRIDFYSVYNQIFFGEMTFYHGSGFEKFTPESYNKLLGSWIDLPDEKK